MYKHGIQRNAKHMAFRLMTIALLGAVHVCDGFPALTLQDLEVADDTHSVGSYVREVRAAPPENYHRSYESDGEGELGYSRKKTGGGKKGYQHFDSYHKKAGDNYEFEKQDSYGKEDGDKQGAYSHRHETKEKPRTGQYRRPRSDDYYESRDENSEKESDQYRKSKSEFEEINEEEQPVSKNDDKESPVEKQHEELRANAPDGNGGVESYGHDVKDYVLPEKYTYGTGDEYNF